MLRRCSKSPKQRTIPVAGIGHGQRRCDTGCSQGWTKCYCIVTAGHTPYDLAIHNASGRGHPVVHSSHLDNESDPRRLMHRPSLCPNLSTARSTVATFSVSLARPTAFSIIWAASNVARCSIPPEYCTRRATQNYPMQHETSACRMYGRCHALTTYCSGSRAARECTGGNHCDHWVATVPSRDHSVRYVLPEACMAPP